MASARAPAQAYGDTDLRAPIGGSNVGAGGGGAVGTSTKESALRRSLREGRGLGVATCRAWSALGALATWRMMAKSITRWDPMVHVNSRGGG